MIPLWIAKRIALLMLCAACGVIRAYDVTLASGSQRPSMVLWLAIEDQQQRRLVGAETDPALQSLLTRLAKQEEIALVLPLMDLEDISSVTVTDVWDQFPIALQKASTRYGAQSILIGRLRHHEEGGENSWEGTLELFEQGNRPTWEVKGQTVEVALTNAFTALAQYLKENRENERPKTASNRLEPKGRSFYIAIEDIQSSTDFYKVETYLKSLDAVMDVNVSQVLGTAAIFEITPRNGNSLQWLMQAINRDHQLIELGPWLQNSPPVEMSYRYVAPLPISEVRE